MRSSSAVVPSGGTCQLERRPPVVGEHLGVILGSAERLDPVGDVPVLRGAVGARRSGRTRRRGRARARRRARSRRRRRSALPAHESLPLQRVERALGAVSVPRRARSSRRPCRPPARRVGAPSPPRETVQARRDDALERLGQGELLRRAPLEVELGELLRVERVAARPLEERLLGLCRQHRPVEELAIRTRGLLLGERRERERRRVQLAAAPAWAPLEQLRAGGRDDEQRDVGHPVDELVDEVEQALVRPVEVLEDEHERTLLRHRLEKASPGREAAPRLSPPSSDSPGEADERAQSRFDPVGVARVREDLVPRLQRASRRRSRRRPARGCLPAP